jgi:hypothetical protein
METTSSALTTRRRPVRPLFASLACALALCVAQAAGAQGQTGQSGAGADVPSASATVEQCVTAVDQAERSATFSGEMTTISGTARMAMRIDVQERMPGEDTFHTLSAPGLGVWRGSAAGVKTYRYLKQITNLSSPAFYRALVRFHWLNDRGHVVRRAERHTPRCAQPAPPPVATSTTPTTTSPSPTH